jgi:hypothetical protein
MSDNESIDDNKSHVSTLSNSLIKMECPFCNKDFQVRAIFNHIYTKHPTDFLQSCTRKWLKEAEAGQPLRIFWVSKNDFGDDVDKVLYVCLSTKKTFLSVDRAANHFKKDKEAQKAHNKELKALLKRWEKKQKEEEEEYKKSPWRRRYQEAMLSSDPSLVRSYYRRALYIRSHLPHLISKTKEHIPLTTTQTAAPSQVIKYHGTHTVEHILALYEEKSKKLDECIQEKVMDYITISDISHALERVLWLVELHDVRYIGSEDCLLELRPNSKYDDEWEVSTKKMPVAPF